MGLTLGTHLGPYEIGAPIGQGGMGEVYDATDTRLNRRVALKVLRNTARDDPEAHRRFRQEGRTIAALNHPHICTLFDVGTADSFDYLVMEYVEGETLAARIRRGRLSLDEAIARGREIAQALAEAHRAGVVHRDLKPSNVILARSGAKLLDFGIALLSRAATGEFHEGTTRVETGRDDGAALGTLPYMAPEQLEGRPADSRADIFAFGALMFEMLVGRPPFQGRGQAVVARFLRDDPPAISTLRPVSAAIDHVVSRCLAKDPDVRWQTATDWWRTDVDS